MSLEAYKIAVKISLVDGVTRGLGLLSRHFKTTDENAAKLEARLKSIGKLTALSAGLAAVGVGGLRMFKGPLEEAKQYQTLIERFRQFGLGDVALQDAQKWVQAQNIVGTSRRDMLGYMIEAQGVFRESGANTVAQQLAAAKMAAPLLAKINFATNGLTGHGMSENQQQDMLRFVEQAGGLRSPQRFNNLMDSAFKSIQSSGGNVNFPLYRQFMSYAGTAGMSLTDRSLFADLEPIIGEMKSRAGVGLRTASNRLNGVVKLPNQIAHELVRMGIWDPTNIEWNNQGGIKTFIPNARSKTANPFIQTGLLASSPADFYANVLLPRYNAMHLTAAQRAIENSKILGGTGGQLFANIDRFLPQIMLSRAALGKARGIDAAVRGVSATTHGKEVDLTAREADLKLRIGKDIMPIYVHGLELAVGVLDRINKLPDGFIKFGVDAAVAVSGMAILGSAFTSLVTGAKAVDAALLAAGKNEVLMPLIGRGLVAMGVGLRAITLALVANPIGLAVVAIVALGVAAYEVWKHWDTIGPLLHKAWDTIKSGVIGFINGIIALANHLPFVHISPIGGASGSPYVAPAAARTFRFDQQVNLDGRKIAQNTSYHQAKAASGPSQGTSRPDWSRAYVPPSLMAR